VARAESEDRLYLAIFNLGDEKSTFRYSWKELGFEGPAYRLRDLWERRDVGTAKSITVELPAHGVMLYEVSSEDDTEGRPQ